METACLKGSVLNCLHDSTLGETLLYEKKRAEPGGKAGVA